jgi:HSP20 family protein
MSDKALTRDAAGTEVASADRAAEAVTFAPNVDILEDAEALVLRADMPGVEPGQVDLRFEGRTLYLSGRATPRLREGAAVHRQEYGVGDYARSFEVPEAVDPAGITAERVDGVLTVRLRKKEAVGSRRIEVR